MKQDLAPSRPGPGRRTHLTLSRLTNIMNLLAAGNYVTTAAKFAGIGEVSFYKWRTRGEKEIDRIASLPGVDVDDIFESFEGDSDMTDKDSNPVPKSSALYMWHHRPEEFDDEVEWPYVVFTFQAEKARAQAEVRILHHIHTAAGKGNWQAGAWWLERTFPDRYGRTDRIQHSGTPGGDPIKHETTITVGMVDQALGAILGDGDDGQH